MNNDASYAYMCSCNHPYKDHDGYARGPEVKEWCNGAGSKWIAIWMEAEGGDKIDAGFEQMNCLCTEYDGPIPDEVVADLLRQGNWTFEPRPWTRREIVTLDNPHGTGWELEWARSLTADDVDYRMSRVIGDRFIGGYRAMARWRCKEGWVADYFWHPDHGWELGAN